MAETKFTFGSILEQEIDRELSLVKSTMQAQLKAVQESGAQHLASMSKTAETYEKQAQQKLNDMDATINERFKPLDAKITSYINTSNARIQAAEAKEASLELKLKSAEDRLLKSEQAIAAISNKLVAVGKAASGVA